MVQVSTPTADGDAELAEIACAVRARGLQVIARELHLPRQTLASVLVGSSREGSRELVLARWRNRNPSGLAVR